MKTKTIIKMVKRGIIKKHIKFLLGVYSERIIKNRCGDTNIFIFDYIRAKQRADRKNKSAVAKIEGRITKIFDEKLAPNFEAELSDLVTKYSSLLAMEIRHEVGRVLVSADPDLQGEIFDHE